VRDDLDWGVTIETTGGEHGGAFTWDAPIKSVEDIDRLRVPEISVDRERTEFLLNVAREMFDGLLDVRLATRWTPLFPMTKNLALFRGLEQTMFDMIDAPELVHRIMAFERDAYLAMLDRLEDEDLLSPNNDGAYVGSGGYGWSDELPQPDFGGVVRAADLWGHSESQETVSVSPEMFAEFVLPYQIPILERFGLNCYGCCEPLDARWHLVETIPNLRRVSVAPRSDRAFMAEALGGRYIMSIKPDPADLAMSCFDEKWVRSQLRRDLEAARGCRIELIMKDNHTIGNEPERAARWVRIAREEIDRL
jgi:hypothetical protein|tara:strand:- start:3869 stop:4789 length:921 start_codon:yes stop_codon:yes gene_type:complete